MAYANFFTQEEIIAREIESRKRKDAEMIRDNKRFASRHQASKVSDFFDERGQLVPILEITFSANTTAEVERLIQDYYWFMDGKRDKNHVNSNVRWHEKG